MNADHDATKLQQRVNPFDNLNDFDVKPKGSQPVVPKEAIDQIAEANNFPSRSTRVSNPIPPSKSSTQKPLRKKRSMSTIPTTQINIRVPNPQSERFYSHLNAQNMDLGEFLIHLLDVYESKEPK
jgi:hypothetical protein